MEGHIFVDELPAGAALYSFLIIGGLQKLRVYKFW